MKLSEYLTKVEVMETPEFLIEDLLVPKRYVLFSGRSGIGKTLLATQLMFSFASGEPWADFKVKPCNCLYINLELPDFQLGDRLRQQSKAFNIIHEPRVESRPFESMPLETDSGLAELEAMITSEPKPEAVIIDSFRQVYGGKIKDNDQQAKWTTNVYHLLDRHNLGIVQIQNTSKAKPFLETGSVEEPIGAIELANRAVSVMVVTAKQKRTFLGQFGSKSSDKVELHIPKYGCSTKQLKTRYLQMNRERLLFEVMDVEEFADEINFSSFKRGGQHKS